MRSPPSKTKNMLVVESVMFSYYVRVKIWDNWLNEIRILLLSKCSEFLPFFFIFESFLGVILDKC